MVKKIKKICVQVILTSNCLWWQKETPPWWQRLDNKGIASLITFKITSWIIEDLPLQNNCGFPRRNALKLLNSGNYSQKEVISLYILPDWQKHEAYIIRENYNDDIFKKYSWIVVAHAFNPSTWDRLHSYSEILYWKIPGLNLACDSQCLKVPQNLSEMYA